MNANINQVTFSERLQLLHVLRFSEYRHPTELVGDEDASEMLHALDVIASCIATGTEGESFAASLDPTTFPPTVILSKTGTITEEDRKFISSFLDAFTSPDTHNFRQVFPLLFSRCFASMKTRMENLYEAARRYLVHHAALLESYQPLSFKEEFPYFHLLHPNHEGREFVATFHMLFADIEKVASWPFHRDSPVNSHYIYTRLHVLSVIIASSRFISIQTERVFSEKTKVADELKRCMERIKEYVGGVNTLIRRSRQVFPDGIIPVKWVGSTSTAVDREDCCWCCDQWMSRYNSLHTTRYVASGASVKIRVDWEMSGLVSPDFFLHHELGSLIKDHKQVTTRRRKRSLTPPPVKKTLQKIEESQEEDV
ncbi:hypothetical protein F5146DRAFT_1119431 [Armillaria mellea]|nr:hypothetical protein F5146DRAFT_1119431 [Armillaria mellea]